MLAASWKAPSLLAPSPKKATATFLVLRNLQEKAAPMAMGGPPPTMPLAPNMPSSRLEMCMLPPLPLQ